MGNGKGEREVDRRVDPRVKERRGVKRLPIF
jgi:hypothetical protein